MSSAIRNDEPFLFIAGVPKAGTTSLFQYLAKHPDVCPCCIKEPFFFLPPAFPVETKLRLGRNRLDDYASLFPDCPAGRLRLEASSLYLHVPGTAAAIRELLPNSRVVVSLRDPISRLISGYQMARFQGWIPQLDSFDVFARDLLARRDDAAATPLYRYAAGQGLYAEAMNEWRQVFGAERVRVIWFDDLQNDPRAVMAGIASFAGLDPAYFENISFEKANPARVLRNPALRKAFQALQQGLRQKVPQGTPLWKTMAAARARLAPVIERLAVKPADRIDPHSDTIQFLTDFYARDVVALEGVLGTRPPWWKRYAHTPAATGPPQPP